MLLLDLIYLLALVALSPWLVWRSVTTGRYRSGLAAKLFGYVYVSNPHKKPVAWFHAVSVGEVNLLGTLVPAFRERHPDWLIVISATTDTGLAEARRRFADLAVIAWPIDFSWAVATTLDAVKPSLIVLTESELWPNYLRAAKQRKVPVVVVNARMSPRSFSRLKRIARLARRWLFANITRFAVQEQAYADRLQQLGVPIAKLVVTGSVKYDGAMKERNTPKTAVLRRLLHNDNQGAHTFHAPIVWLAGSTHAPEESIVLGVFSRLRERFPHLRLILVTRHPDRFEEVARLVEQSGLSFVRRSRIVEPLSEMPSVILLDTIGELGAAWGLADVGFTGGSLDGKRGGQSMIEPAGYGVPCVFGPHVWNFKDTAKRLVEVGGAVMVPDALGLETALTKLIADSELRTRMGIAALELVRRQQGATARTLDVIDKLLVPIAVSQAA
ncbi:MAG TPA: 3-deoxy-D-manno-octulosonic acid transferase [Gemmata sp.]|jgi:3-deoxy-D-manno-octulosonic-acid transferase|nr:3-deoxy-D-manno-octulosonic acid transferase [Gemmata sp.]